LIFSKLQGRFDFDRLNNTEHGPVPYVDSSYNNINDNNPNNNSIYNSNIDKKYQHGSKINAFTILGLGTVALSQGLLWGNVFVNYFKRRNFNIDSSAATNTTAGQFSNQAHPSMNMPESQGERPMEGSSSGVGEQDRNRRGGSGSQREDERTSNDFGNNVSIGRSTTGMNSDGSAGTTTNSVFSGQAFSINRE